MTATTDYKKRNDIGEIAALLFGTLPLTSLQADRIHAFFQEAVPQYILGKNYTPIFREQLPVAPSSYYSNGAIYDIFDVSSPGTSIELTVRIQQGKAEAVEEDRLHYRIRIVLKGEAVSEQMKHEIENQIKELDRLLFSATQEKREEFLQKYLQ